MITLTNGFDDNPIIKPCDIDLGGDMTVSNKKIANTTLSVIKIMADNNCNALEAREVARAILAVINSQRIDINKIEDKIIAELSERYCDSSLSCETYVF